MAALVTVQDRDPSGWMTSAVPGQKHSWTCVLTSLGDKITVDTTRTCPYRVEVRFSVY